MPKSTNAKRPSKTSSKSISKQPALTPTPHKSPSKYPFSTPPPSLIPFLSTLPPTHIYLIHTDNFPIRHKRLIFTVPLLLNVFLTAIIIWRAYVAIPAYFTILLATLGFDNGASVDLGATDWGTLIEIGANRTGMFFIDFALARFVAVWPMDFFLGTPMGPVKWRWAVGFRDREVVVRKSRRWEELVVGVDEEVVGDGERGGKAFEERIIPGIDAAWVRGRSGMAMLDKNWDLWFPGMADAHILLDNGRIEMMDFQGRTVAVHTEERGWLCWRIVDQEGGETREKLQRVKGKLDSMGKEGLFWKWVELVQFETEGREVLTGKSTGREEIMSKGKSLFEEEGVDFDDFWHEVGGLEGMPGVDVSG